MTRIDPADLARLVERLKENGTLINHEAATAIRALSHKEPTK